MQVGASDSVDEDGLEPRPGASPDERPVRLDCECRSAHRGSRVARANAGDPTGSRCREGIWNRCRGDGQGQVAIDCRSRASLLNCPRACVRPRVDRSRVQDARASRGISQSGAHGALVLLGTLRRCVSALTGDLRHESVGPRFAAMTSTRFSAPPATSQQPISRRRYGFPPSLRQTPVRPLGTSLRP